MAGNVFMTAIGNGVNLLFPTGERFFMRSVRRYVSQLSPALREQVEGFFGQEGRHAQAHERVIEILAEQGYQVDAFLHFHERFNRLFMERIVPPALRLATTAACEHFTAIMANNFLRQTEFLEGLDPTMGRLLLWHAAEELEHKAVAFDVLQAVSPSYALRLLGLGLAAPVLGVLWFSATIMLLNQERRQLGLSRILEDARKLRRTRDDKGHGGIVRDVFLHGIREYSRRDFHPDDEDNYELAERYFASASLG